ncbi:MAG: SpoVT/AbrB domain protein [Pedosphaera sp.]|nr:SpoVT/AbrB domain protein [Pedosphaera sp.]
MVYTSHMKTAKVFMNGRSQAIRLPKEFRVKAKEVHLRKVPEGFLVMESDPWETLLEACQELPDDFMATRVQPPTQKRDWRGASK